MTNINIYDIEAKTLEDIAERNDTTVAEIVEMLMDYINDVKKDNNLN